MNFHTRTILFKVTIFFIGLVIIGIFGYLSKRYMNKETDYLEFQVNLFKENNLTSVDIAYYAERVITGDDDAKAICTENIIIYDLNLSVLRAGGNPVGYKENKVLKPAESYIIKDFAIQEKIWLNYKENIEKLINEKLFIRKRIETDSIIDGEISKKYSFRKEVNPAVKKIKNKTGELLKKLIKNNSNLTGAINLKKQKLVSLQNKLDVLIILLFLLVIGASYLFLYKNFFSRLKLLKKSTDNLLSGSDIENNIKRLDDEIQPVFDNVDKTSRSIIEITNFVRHIEDDNLNIEIEKGKEGSIQNALIKLRDKLRKSKEEEIIRKEQEEIRQWAVNGQSNFNEIMRRSSSNLQELVDELTKEIVYFLKAAQGGLFLYIDDEKDNYLELKSAFAYDRKKHHEKKISLGDGLIGMCALEKNTIYIEKIPENYIEIESGLGESNPGSLLIIPLKTETELLGVLELASFHKFKEHEVKFVEHLAETVASTLETARISSHTGDLLEETKKKSDELAARDTEMTQNIKELRDAQEQAKTKESEMDSILQAVDRVLLKAEIATGGNFMSINVLYQELLGYHLEEIQNKLLQDVFDPETSHDFSDLWKKVLAGETVQTTHKQYTKQATEVWLLSQYTPVLDEAGNVLHVLYLGNDITNQKETEDSNKKLINEKEKNSALLTENEEKINKATEELEKIKQEKEKKEKKINSLNVAIDNTFIRGEYNIRGTLLVANKKMLETWKCEKTEIINRNIRNYILEDDLPVFEKTWSNLRNGTPFAGKEQILDTKGNKIRLNVSFTPIESKQGEDLKILLLASDITAQKDAEQKIENLSKEIGLHEEQIEKTIGAMMKKQEIYISEIEKSSKKNIKISETKQDIIYREWIEKI